MTSRGMLLDVGVEMTGIIITTDSFDLITTTHCNTGVATNNYQQPDLSAVAV